MNDLTVFVGGSIGYDPYDPKTWSGSCPALLGALQADSLLEGAVGVKLPGLLNTWLMAKNFNPTREVWRRHFYFDPAYRRAMTRVAGSIPVGSPACLQLGHWYNLPSVFPGKTCLSYHDGNLPGALSSGFAVDGVSKTRIDQALRFEEDAANQMAAVLTFSEYVRQSFIRDYHVPAERVYNIGAGFNLSQVPDVVAKDYSAPRMLFVGGEFGRKGGATLLKALAIVRETIPAAELHVVGPLTLEPVPAGVVFHGRLSKSDPVQLATLNGLFRDCNLFVLPSLYEPFGIAPLEAMSNRLPCLLTDAWAFQEFVTPGYNGDLVEKGNAEDLAAKMIVLLSDPARLAEMGARARDRVLSQYTWPAVSGRIGKILKTLGVAAD